MGNIAIKLGKLGSAIGVLVGLIEMFIGAQIRPWIGNKENPAILGLITFFLSGIAFFSVRSACNNVKLTNDGKLAIILGVLLPTAICFTTVGRLWYLSGSLLIMTSLLLAYEYWFVKLKGTSPQITFNKLRAIQIIGVIGSLIVLASVVLAFSNSNLGLFRCEILTNAERFSFEVLPMDFVRCINLSGSVMVVENIEVSLVMIVYIFLIVGAVIALIASLVKSRIFNRIGGILVLAGLVLFFIWLPKILAQTELPSIRFQYIFRSLGLGYYIATVGMCLIIISSFIQLQRDNTKNCTTETY